MSPNCDNHTINVLKIAALLFTLSVGLIGSLSAARCGRASTAFRIASMYAAGQFIGVALLHLAWSADATLRKTLTEKYPIAPLVVILSLLGTQLADKLVHKHAAKRHSTPTPVENSNGATDRVNGLLTEQADKIDEPAPHSFGLLFVVILALHSIFGGLVIGMQTALHSTVINFIAFGAHKGVAGYALGLDLAGSGHSWTTRAACCSIFSVSTPIGVAIGMLILRAASVKAGHIISAIFGALSAGSFLYIALGEVSGELENARLRPLTVVLAGLLGIGVMALIFPVIIFPDSGPAEVLCLSD